jgi:hypothetical protein
MNPDVHKMLMAELKEAVTLTEMAQSATTLAMNKVRMVSQMLGSVTMNDSSESGRISS